MPSFWLCYFTLLLHAGVGDWRRYLCLWLLQRSGAESAAPTRAGNQAAVNGPVDAGARPRGEVSPKTTSPKQKLAGAVTRKGVWELAEGETGLLSYVSERTKTNGMMLVKLTTDEKGWIILEKKSFNLKDESLNKNGLEAYMPELMQFEKFGKLSAAEAQELIQILETTEGVSSGGDGRSHYRADVPRGGSSMSTNREKQMVIKETERMLPSSPDEAGLHRVEVEYTTEFGPGSIGRDL